MPERHSSSMDHDAGIATDQATKVKPPRMYQVFLLNDDYTPMDFVIWVLQSVFHKDLAEATRLMLDVHRKGQGLCGVFTYDIARTKVYQVKRLAKKEGHPLECLMEEA